MDLMARNLEQNLEQIWKSIGKIPWKTEYYGGRKLLRNKDEVL